jgi:hypothetical protein
MEPAHTASPDSPNEMRPSSGTSRKRDRRRIHRKDPFNFETDSAVAFARRRNEPRSVDLDLATSLGRDRSGRAQIAHQKRHRRSSHAGDLRQRPLGEREHIVVDAVIVSNWAEWSDALSFRALCHVPRCPVMHNIIPLVILIHDGLY